MKRCDTYTIFQSLRVEVSGPEDLVKAVGERLSELPASDGGPIDLSIEYRVVDSSECHAVGRPVGECRPFYEPEVGEATYFSAHDECYMDYDSRVRVWCDAARGRCVISVLYPAADQLWLATHPLLTLPLLEMLKRRGKFGIHAAGFARAGRSLLLPGSSGSGKSTLILALLQAGFDFLGDDLTFLEIESGLAALAFPETIDLTENTLSFFPELLKAGVTSRRPDCPKYQLLARDFCASNIAWRTEPVVLVFPAVNNTAESFLTPLTVEEAFVRLSSSVLLTEKDSTRSHLNALGELTRKAPAFCLHTGRDLDQAAQLLGGLLA